MSTETLTYQSPKLQAKTSRFFLVRGASEVGKVLEKHPCSNNCNRRFYTFPHRRFDPLHHPRDDLSWKLGITRVATHQTEKPRLECSYSSVSFLLRSKAKVFTVLQLSMLQTNKHQQKKVY